MREAFAYKESHLFWSQELQFEPRSVYRRFPSPSLSMSDPRLPSSSSSCSPPPSESQYTPVPSVMEEVQSDPKFTLSITPTTPSLPPTTSLTSSCADIVPESEPKSPSITPISLSQPFVPSPTSSCHDVLTELASVPHLWFLIRPRSQSALPSLFNRQWSKNLSPSPSPSACLNLCSLCQHLPYR